MKRSQGRAVFVASIGLAVIGAIGLAILSAPPMAAAASDYCPAEATILSLQTCVRHAADAGFIDNQGVTGSLLAELDAAQAAFAHGQRGAAIDQVQAFAHDVQAQRGEHIEAEHADHMLMHADMVIQALAGS